MIRYANPLGIGSRRLHRIMPNKARPAGVLVSTACWCRNRPQRASRSSCSVASRSGSDRPRRSTDHASRMSNLPRTASLHAIEPGALVPALGAADAVVVVGGHHLPAPLRADRLKGEALVL